MTTTILDLENWTAQGATAVLIRKKLTVRLSFQLNGAPPVRSLASVGRGNDCNMVPVLLAVEYSKTDNDEWEVTMLRMYGHKEHSDETALNVYPHDTLHDKRVPAWVRDAVYGGMPK